MTAEEFLRKNESGALNTGQFVTHISGRQGKSKKKKTGSLISAGFLVLMIAVIGILFSFGNILPSAVSERLIEETDVQYADAVESKKLVFQQAMYNGELPEDTIKILETNGVLVGRSDNGQIYLKQGDKIITADNFINEVGSNVALYEAFNLATYSRAAYYYDDAAMKVFREIGSTRDNYTSDLKFEEVMDSVVGSGNNININNVALVEKIVKDEKTREEKKILEYEELGESAKTGGGAKGFINSVSEKNWSNSVNSATLNSADALKVADTIAKEQRSSLFFLAFMENISKMKAGEGNDSKINEAMNFLYDNQEYEIVDVNTGNIIKVSGTPLESPSLYAVLSGNKINTDDVSNYSSDRVLKTIQNRLGDNDNSAMSGTVTSTNNRTTGSIGRFIELGVANSSADTLYAAEKTINDSLVNNSFETIKGVGAGEFLVEGAINVGKKLAKASGATAGDASAVTAYQNLSSKIIAMDKEIERKRLSPFDISSSNTFLGSIMLKFANIFNKSTTLISSIKNTSSVLSSSLVSLMPKTYAAATETYLNNFGSCSTIGQIGAVGSAQCAEIATFDPSTLNNPFGDAGFINFVNNNTSLNESGTRTINSDSALADFIIYNNERKTPIGVMDGGILDSLVNNSDSIPFLGDILSMIKIFLGADENDKRVATGAVFVNSSANPDWQNYKYAQRYVSLARATESLRQYSNNSTAYNNIMFFEGDYNPVMAFLESFYASNNNLVIPEIFD